MSADSVFDAGTVKSVQLEQIFGHTDFDFQCIPVAQAC